MAAEALEIVRRSAAISSGAAHIAHITKFVCSSTKLSPEEHSGS
jgi:hypothetical protein